MNGYLHTAKRLIRLREVKNQVGWGKRSTYRLVTLGEFPAPRKLGTRCVAWLQSDVDSWIDGRQKTA